MKRNSEFSLWQLWNMIGEQYLTTKYEIHYVNESRPPACKFNMMYMSTDDIADVFG